MAELWEDCLMSEDWDATKNEMMIPNSQFAMESIGGHARLEPLEYDWIVTEQVKA